ncbi:isopentenyl-diphosphate Delta-isomerase [Rathayibacter sp. YIM 133350]|uniref:isopentenyl-diphosphate Delta-isomerase n=1 Tax=Rathayibacter sp. YIM 133350 TaxID=3131992 RepID=UPI00307E3665
MDDEIVLVDLDGAPVGTAMKAEAHGPDTALHLAFSCYVVDRDGRLLVTRRALAKRTWPGVWTNSFCGHPRPAEPLLSAVHRRADAELGIRVRDVQLVLPLFRYRATDAGGTVENEICPVYIAVTDDAPDPDPREVAEFTWVSPAALVDAVEATPWAFSPWMVLQLGELERFHA